MTPEGLALVMRFEGCKLSAYQDIVGVWTIGYGSTTGVFDGQTITQAEADRRLEEELAHFREKVLELSGDDASDFEADAMTSLAYNIGVGAFQSSSVLRFHKLGHFRDAADAFLMWNKAGGRVVKGLADRRAAERDLYLRGAPA